MAACFWAARARHQPIGLSFHCALLAVVYLEEEINEEINNQQGGDEQERKGLSGMAMPKGAGVVREG
ncbi:MAG: hypothetical protein ACLVKA_09060 [Collinsella aerofaciens]